jgi:hypothetical protein
MRKAGADTTAKITDITMKIVKLLTPLDSDGRKKVIKASLTLLGEAALELENGGTGSAAELGLSAKADAWIRQNGLTKAQLEEVFEIDGENTTLIADNVPGKSKKEQTIAAYIIQGIVKLLGTGEPTFDDKSARKLCEHLGCYNAPNHALYVDSIGNSVTGSKDKGWKLTAPGLKKGAELVKEMTTETAKES